MCSTIPRGRLYLVRAPPLVLLDDRVELFCPYLGGLCEDLVKAAAAGRYHLLVEEFLKKHLDMGELGIRALAKAFPQAIPLLLRKLEARLAGPSADELSITAAAAVSYALGRLPQHVSVG